MRVLKASCILTPVQKLVALEIHGLDCRQKPAGRACFATADTLAERLGTPVGTVERVRRDLLAYGLLERLRRFQAADWAVTLPLDCCPRTDRVSPDDLIRHREALDAHLRSFSKVHGRVKPCTEAGNNTLQQSSVTQSTQSAKRCNSAAGNVATAPPPTKEEGEEEEGDYPSPLPGEEGVNEKTENDKTDTLYDRQRWADLAENVEKTIRGTVRDR